MMGTKCKGIRDKGNKGKCFSLAPYPLPLIPLTLIILALLLFAGSASAKPHPAQTFKLQNGMEVVVIPNTKMPVISHMVWYKIGSADEPPGKSGIAHFLEHLMFKSTTNYELGEFSKQISKTGGNDNAFTDTDYTAYYQNVPKGALELVMELESDRMENLMILEKEVRKERDVILEERRSRIENNPRSLLQEQMKASLYLNHPYHKPIIGWYHEMEKLSAEDARRWYKNYYNPANAVLVVSGDVTAEELKPLAERYYGTIPAGKAAIRNNFTKEPDHLVARRMVFKDRKVAKPELLRYYTAPSAIYGKKEYAYPLILLSYLLGASDTSMLYQNMVIDGKKAINVGSYYDDMKMGPSIFVLNAVPDDDVSLEKIEEILDENIKIALQSGFKEEDLKRAKKALIADTIYSREDLKTVSNMYGQAVALGLGTQYVDDWEKNINSVTLANINLAAKYVLQPKNSVTGYLLPGDKE